MKKLKIILTALLMSISVVGYADTPTKVNDASQRFILVTVARWEHKCFKMNTRTGEVWFIDGDCRIERIRTIKCTGIQTVSESDSFNGRFCLHFMQEAGVPWVYVLDSVTGSVWAMGYARGMKSDFNFIPIP